jgi:hypothetical protein
MHFAPLDPGRTRVAEEPTLPRGVRNVLVLQSIAAAILVFALIVVVVGDERQDDEQPTPQTVELEQAQSPALEIPGDPPG